MIEVDLLKGGGRVRKRRPSGPGTGWRVRGILVDGWVAGSVLTMLLCLGFAGHLALSLRGRSAGLDVALEAAVRDSAQKSAGVQEARKRDARRDSVAARVAMIQEIDAARYLWPHIMDEVVNALPAEAWLTRLAQVPEVRGGTRFRVEGMARDNLVITRFWNGLESSPFIGNVQLISTEHLQEARGRDAIESLYHFALEAGQEAPMPELLDLVPLPPRPTP